MVKGGILFFSVDSNKSMKGEIMFNEKNSSSSYDTAVCCSKRFG